MISPQYINEANYMAQFDVSYCRDFFAHRGMIRDEVSDKDEEIRELSKYCGTCQHRMKQIITWHCKGFNYTPLMRRKRKKKQKGRARKKKGIK